MRNFQILVVSAVKICSVCKLFQLLGRPDPPLGDFRRQVPWVTALLYENLCRCHRQRRYSCEVPRTRTSLNDRYFTVAGPRMSNNLGYISTFVILNSFYYCNSASCRKRACLAEERWVYSHCRFKPSSHHRHG